jgi:hypothetical protein
MAADRKPWSRDELLVAFNLYCRTPFGRLHCNYPDVIARARKLAHTFSSLAMKLCHFGSLDPVHQLRNVAGLRNTFAADRSSRFQSWPPGFGSRTTCGALCVPEGCPIIAQPFKAG